MRRRGPKQARGKKARAKRTRRQSKPTGARHYIFFYGTLKRGGRNQARLRGHDVQFVREGRIQADLYNLEGEKFPGAVPATAPSHFVTGELFVLRNPEETLRYLDKFEGVGKGIFERQLMEVSGGGRSAKAWVYMYARSVMDADRIPSGVYSSR